MRGYFITFEGGEGTGKSTQARRLADVLRTDGHRVVLTREPGGSPGAEAVRHVLLSGRAEEYGTSLEAILFAAARNDHVEEVIRPAVEAGAIVLCDRFMDSSRVYQGVTGNLDPPFMRTLERLAVADMVPDLTLIFDLPPEKGLARARGRDGGEAPDRYEKEEMEIHSARRNAFQELALNEPERCVLIDADRSEGEIADRVLDIVRNLIEPDGAERDAGAPQMTEAGTEIDSAADEEDRP